LDVNTTSTHKVIEWKIDRSILAPRLGMSLIQQWPYAPYQAMITTLPLAARASTFFLTLVIITLLLCSVDIRPSHLALLGLLFMVPFLILMSGGIPHPASVSMEQFANYQSRMLPLITLLPLILAFFILRKMPRLPLILILILMALFAGGYPLIGLLPDEQKRKAFETISQVGMIAYIFLLALFTRLNRVNRQGV
jgi:hypothetical protein